MDLLQKLAIAIYSAYVKTERADPNSSVIPRATNGTDVSGLTVKKLPGKGSGSEQPKVRKLTDVTQY